MARIGRLFVGGPRHGQTRLVEQDRTKVRVTIPRDMEWLWQEDSAPPLRTSFDRAEYVFRTAELGDHMPIACMVESGAKLDLLVDALVTVALRDHPEFLAD